MPRADRTRVGYVLKVYPRLCETFILGEILAHEAAGVDMEIFSLRPTSDSRFHEALSRVRAPVTYVQGHSIRTPDLWQALCRARVTFPKADTLMDIAAGEDADAVFQAVIVAEAANARGIGHLHAHFGTLATTVARLAAHLCEIPYTFTAHAKDLFHESVDERDLRRKIAGAHAVVAVSDYNLDHLRSHFGEDASRVRRIYNGLDLQEFPWQPPTDHSSLIVSVGRLVEKKGFNDLIDACNILARRNHPFTCQIIGDGGLRGVLQQQIDRLGLTDRVQLLGPQTRSEVMNLLQRASVFAAPCILGSDGNRDSLPTVILEAMALGTPCISTDVGGIPEMIHDGRTGLIVPQHDPTALADALARLMDDQALRANFSTNARRLLETEFDIHRNTARMREVFTSGRRPAPREAVEVG